MVETACENNEERKDSDSDTIENIVEKGIYGGCSFSWQSELWVLPSKTDNRSIKQLNRYFLIVGVTLLIVVQKL